MAPPDDVHHRLGALPAESVTVMQQAAAKDLPSKHRATAQRQVVSLRLKNWKTLKKSVLKMIEPY
jgi:hypothetical protein